MADVEVNAGTQTTPERFGVSRYEVLLRDDDNTVDFQALDRAGAVPLGVTVFDADAGAHHLTDVRAPAIRVDRPGSQSVEFRLDPQDTEAVLVNGVRVDRDPDIRPHVEVIQEQGECFADFARGVQARFAIQTGPTEREQRLIARMHLIAGIGMRFPPYGTLIFGPTFIGLSAVRLIYAF